MECGLRLVGFTISSYQQYKNNKALKNKSQYTIMYLGESTTQDQYPIQLQKILDKKYPSKFSVVDCGIAGTNLETILRLLDDNINIYKPNIVICMMGINNGLTSYNAKTSYNEYMNNKLKLNLKVFKFFILLKKHIQSLSETKKIFAQDTNLDRDYMINLAREYRNIDNYVKAEEILEAMLKENPNDELVFFELSFSYIQDYEDKYELGYKMAVEAIEKNYNIGKEWYYNKVFEHNDKNRKNDIQTLKFYIDKAINKDIEIFSTNLKYFLYSSVKDYITQEQKEKILQVMIQNDDRDYGMFAIESLAQKDYQKAKEYFEKAEEIRMNFPDTKTYKLYKLIVKKLIDNNIKVICMQYPVRSIESLKEQLKNEPYYPKLTFISNEKIFKDILTKKEYDEIFMDQFAGDFGHCINLGNTMIAENIVETLEELTN